MEYVKYPSTLVERYTAASTCFVVKVIQKITASQEKHMNTKELIDRIFREYIMKLDLTEAVVQS
ncbi:MAG: hypothetical protein ABI351_12515 [Herbaspirillum sp.]